MLKEDIMNNQTWFKVAAIISFFMAAFQAFISLSPSLAAWFQAPPSLVQDRIKLFLVGEAAALIPILFCFYALSGAGIIRRLILLRPMLILISVLFMLRGSFIILTILRLLGHLPGENLIQGVASHLVFLAAGVSFSMGTLVNWSRLGKPGARMRSVEI